MNIVDDFFKQHGEKQLADIPITANQLYMIFEARRELEAQENLEKAWPTIGTAYETTAEIKD